MSDVDTEDRRLGLIYRSMWSGLLFVLAVGVLLQSLRLFRWANMVKKDIQSCLPVAGVWFGVKSGSYLFQGSDFFFFSKLT